MDARKLSKLGLLSVRKALQNANNYDWVVEDFFIAGGTSFLVGPPKLGKTTAALYMTKCIAQGEPVFRQFKTKQGMAVYLALEENPSALANRIQELGFGPRDPVAFRIGGLNEDPISYIARICDRLSPSIIVVDTLGHLFPHISINDYNKMGKAMKEVADIARDTGAHICYTHHSNKDNKILGSTAIFGAVDNAIFMDQEGESRIIFTKPRYGELITRQYIVGSYHNHTASLNPQDQDGLNHVADFTMIDVS